MLPPSNQLQHNLTLALRCYFPDFRKNQLELLVLVVVALIQAQSVKHSKLAERVAGVAQFDSALRRIERFFERHPVTQADIAPLVLACLAQTPLLTLVLDRTNWKLGKTDINILVLSVLHGKTAIPLLWECLPHSGNSNAQTRTDLLEDLFCVLDAERIGILLADREFVGAKWFDTLWSWAVPFCIRIRDDSRLDDVPAGEFFADIEPGQTVLMGHELWCYGLPLYMAVTLSPEQTRVIVASNLPALQALFEYRKRWRIECLFRHLKTGGFQLEETHMVDHDKLERLWCVLVVAYLWCTLLGQPEPIRIKAHGRAAKAVFVAGLNLLTRGLQQTGVLFEQFVYKLISLLDFSSCKTVGY